LYIIVEHEEGVYSDFYGDTKTSEDLIQEFRKLKVFLQKAVEENQALISFLC